MIGYPLDSHVSYGTDGTPIWDRAISSAALRKLTKKLFSDGVLPNPSTNLQVEAVSGVIVKILSGFALCNGCQKLQEVDVEIKLPSADATYDRIDTVVLRLDDNDDVRACDFMVIKGVAASTPQAPVLTQSDSIWEIGLANIYRKANSTEVTNANITDTRYDTSRCGIISSISQFDTKTLYQQIEADLEEFKNVNQADFFTWFESLKNVLSEDIAANLLNLINKLKTEIGKLEDLKTESKVSIVDAINELKNGLDNLDTLTTIEQVNASTNPEKPVGAGAVKELANSLGEDENGMTVHEKLDKLLENGISSIEYVGIMQSDGYNETETLGTNSFYYIVSSNEILKRALGIFHYIGSNIENKLYQYRNGVRIKEYDGLKHAWTIPNSTWTSDLFVFMLEDLQENDKLFIKGAGTGVRDIILFRY